jgi:hypothetical protein
MIAGRAFLACCFAMTTAVAQATVTQTDLLVGARALGFMQNPPASKIRVGIVYATNVPKSVEEADQLQGMFAGGLKVGNLDIMPIKVKIDELAGANVEFFWLTEYVGADGVRVADATRVKQIPCITVDIAQVQNGNCVMGVRAQPRVEIIVNRTAAARNGLSFATVFRMLITEI